MKHLSWFGGLWAGAALVLFSSCQSTAQGVEPRADSFGQLTIYEGSWTDSRHSPSFGKFADREDGPFLVANVVEWDGWPKMKEFTSRASKDWLLQGSDGSEVRCISGTGGTSSGDGDLRAIIIRPKEPLPAANSSVTYKLVPVYQVEGARWVVLPQVRIHR